MSGTKRKQSQSTLISNYFRPLNDKGNSIQTSQPTAVSDKRSSSPDSDQQTPTMKRQKIESRNALTTLMSPKIKEFRAHPESPRTARYIVWTNTLQSPSARFYEYVENASVPWELWTLCDRFTRYCDLCVIRPDCSLDFKI